MFSHGYITNNGKEMIARAVAGEKLTFTRMEYGDGVLEGVDTAASEDEIKTLYQGVESLVNKCADVALVDVVTEGNVSTVRGMLLFESYTRAFSARELAVFGRIGEEEERIVAYFGSVDSLGGEVQDASDFILLASKDRPHYVTVDVITSSVSGIGVEYDPRVYVSQEDFAAHKEENKRDIDALKEENKRDIDALKEVVNNLLLAAHPVGSLYWSSDPTNPKELFGGEWEQITDRFIYAAGSKTVNATGGSETVKLTESNLPAHKHTMDHDHTGSVSGTVGATNTNHTHGIQNVVKSGLKSGLDGLAAGREWSSYKKISPCATATNGCNSNSTHSHSWSGSVTIDTKTADTGSVGGGTAHENMPPYLVKYCWERVS